MQEIFARYRRLWRPISRPTFFFVTALLFPLVLQVCVCKMLKYRQLSPYWRLWEAASALLGDLFFFGVVFVLFLVWLEWARGWWRRFGRVVLHVLVFAWMVLAAVEHGFFATTGSVGDWYLLRYGFTQVSIMAKLIASKMPWSALLLIYLVAVHLFPYTLGKFSTIHKWRYARASSHLIDRFWWRLPLLLVLVSPWVLPLHIFKIGELKYLNQNVFVRIGYQMAADVRQAAAKNGIKEVHKPVFHTRNLRWEQTKKTKPFNVVLIILESQRASATSMYKPYLKTTPYLAKLAKKGLLVEHMYPVIPHTSKALVSTLCGIPPKITMPAVEGRRKGLPGNCLPKLFNSIGYKTAFFSSATNRFEHRQQLLDNMGFKTTRTYEHLSKVGFEKTNNFGYEDNIMIKPSLKWVDDATAQKKPFFLSYLTLVSHIEYNTPRRFKTQRFSKRSDREFNKYLNAIYYTDIFVKKLMKGFEKRGLFKNTLFIFQADHGEGFSEHGKRQHDNAMYEETAHSASLLFGPGVLPRTGTIKGLRQQTDLTPTIADLLGLRLSGGLLPGQSLLRPVPADRKMFMSCWYRHFCMSLRRGPIKYIYHYHRQKPEVFNITKDPQEKNNLAAKTPKAEIKKAIAEMYRMQKRINTDYESSTRKMLRNNTSMLPFKPKTPVNIRFGEMLRFVGYTIHNKSTTVERGGYIDVTFVFQALRKIPKHWKIFSHNISLKPRRFHNADYDPFNGAYPLWQWKPRQYIRYRYQMPLERKFRAGAIVKLTTGMWARGLGQAPIYGAKGRKLKTKRYPYITVKIIKSTK